MATEENKSDGGAAGQERPAAKPKLMTRIGTALTGGGPSDAHTETPKSSNELAGERTDLAENRTLMAADRSLMAWVRTALSMISFGFTIYKVLQGLQESGEMIQNHNPQTIGLFLTGLGTVSMLMGTIEYWGRITELRKVMYIRTWRPTFTMALIMSITGMFFFISIVTKLL